MRPSGNTVASIESLESRTLFSALPYSVTTENAVDGLHLVIVGTDKVDTIIVKSATGGLRVTNGAGGEQYVKGNFTNIEIHGGRGADMIQVGSGLRVNATIYGDQGRDTIIGGGGINTIYAAAGGGTIVTGSSGQDTVVCNATNNTASISGAGGSRNFWFTRRDQTVSGLSGAEMAGGNVHYIDSFVVPAAGGGSTTTVSASNSPRVDLPDPILSGNYAYRNFSDHPLFGKAGPQAADVRQGYVGDCWLVSTLASVAKTNPGDIRKLVTGLGDGTYAVRFHRGNSDVYVRVDGDLATSGGDLAYARFGSNGSIWTAIVEKAYTYFRRGDGKYASLNGGWMSEAFAGLGFAPVSVKSVANGQQLLGQIQAWLNQGKAVTYAAYTSNAGAPLISYHAYTVMGVVTDATGKPIAMQVRNPWGYDGAGNDGNPSDGIVTVTADQAFQCFWAIEAASV